MRKAIKRIRLYALGVAIIELLSFVTLFLFMYFDWLGFMSALDPFYLMVGALLIQVLNFFLYWVSISSINRVRSRSDLETATLVGSDIQEAYGFGKIGLVVIDEDQTVLWTNSLFRDLQVNFVDSPISSINKKLVELIDAPSSEVAKVDVKGRIYEVKYVSESRLFIFHDVHEYEKILSLSKEEAPCLGVIMIDNYAERVGEEEDANDTLAKVRGAIGDYFREKGALLRRVSADTYFAVCNWKVLEKMEKDGFAVLEKVRSCQGYNQRALTLSIGFAHDFPDTIKLNEMASDAIDIALSRGGDQAVVSRFGADLLFYGGKTAAIETQSKVKVRSFADSVLSLIKSSSSVLVMGHDEMDMDALGACMGIRAMCEHEGKSCKIIYSPKKAEKKTREAFLNAFNKDTFDTLTIDPGDALGSVKDSTLVVVVDVSRPKMTMAPEVLEKASKVVVIDHHRRAEDFIEKPVLSYIETSASSASEMIAEMIRYATANPRIEVKPEYATIMLSGIFLDTNYFKNKVTGMRTFEAAEILKEFGADNSLADSYLKDEFEEFNLITKILSTMHTPFYGVVQCVSDEREIVERSTLAKVANQLMQLKGVHACFVVGKTEEKVIRISARSDGTINVQLILEHLGGGGHFSSAATAFTGTSMDRVLDSLQETLEEYLDSARSSAIKEGDRL